MFNFFLHLLKTKMCNVFAVKDTKDMGVSKAVLG